MMNYFYKIKKYWLLIGVVCLLLVIVGNYIFFNAGKEVQEVLDNELVLEVKKDEPEKTQEIVIDIKGSVAHPGIYKLPLGSRVMDAIKASGGVISNADTSVINLSKKLFDEMVIIIYSKKEIAEMKENNTKIIYLDSGCECPVVENDACLEETISNNISEKEEQISSKISLNTATLEQLDSLPGIGPSKAQDIINYRNNNGLYKTIDDIKNVGGIGEATFEAIKDLITI